MDANDWSLPLEEETMVRKLFEGLPLCGQSIPLSAEILSFASKSTVSALSGFLCSSLIGIFGRH